MLCLCGKTYCCYDNKSDKMKFISKGLNIRILEESGDGPMEKYRKVLDGAINLTSTNRGFRIINHMVATYEQTKKGCPRYPLIRRMLLRVPGALQTEQKIGGWREALEKEMNLKDSEAYHRPTGSTGS